MGASPWQKNSYWTSMDPPVPGLYHGTENCSCNAAAWEHRHPRNIHIHFKSKLIFLGIYGFIIKWTVHREMAGNEGRGIRGITCNKGPRGGCKLRILSHGRLKICSLNLPKPLGFLIDQTASFIVLVSSCVYCQKYANKAVHSIKTPLKCWRTHAKTPGSTLSGNI